jgi:hypothetical protein
VVSQTFITVSVIESPCHRLRVKSLSFGVNVSMMTCFLSRLMLNRIKWEEDTVKDSDGNESANKCVLVWEVRCFLF